MVGSLEHAFYDFPYFGNNNIFPIYWNIYYFSEGLKPPSRFHHTEDSFNFNGFNHQNLGFIKFNRQRWCCHGITGDLP